MGITADVLTVLTGFGSVAVTHKDTTTRGLLDDAEAEQDVGDGTTARFRTRVVRLATATVPTLALEDTLTVGTIDSDTDTTDYRVVDVLREADGAVWRVLVVA